MTRTFSTRAATAWPASWVAVIMVSSGGMALLSYQSRQSALTGMSRVAKFATFPVALKTADRPQQLTGCVYARTINVAIAKI